MKRVLKPGGHYLFMGSGASWVGLITRFLSMKAGVYLQNEGSVFHLPLEDILLEDPDFEVVHMERKSLGRNYVGILKKKEN